MESLRAELSFPGGMKVNFDTADPNAKIDAPGLAFLGEIFKLDRRGCLYRRARRQEQGEGDRGYRKTTRKRSKSSTPGAGSGEQAV